MQNNQISVSLFSLLHEVLSMQQNKLFTSDDHTFEYVPFLFQVCISFQEFTLSSKFEVSDFM